MFLGFPGSSDGKESACNAGDKDSVPGLGISPRGDHGWQPTPVFIPGESRLAEVPGGLQSMNSQRVRQDKVPKHIAVKVIIKY